MLTTTKAKNLSSFRVLIKTLKMNYYSKNYEINQCLKKKGTMNLISINWNCCFIFRC